MSVRKKAVKAVLVFAAVVLAGLLLLCAAFALPAGRVTLHVRESGNVLATEDDYYMLLPTDNTSRLDNYTDALMLLSASYWGGGSPLDKALNNYIVLAKDASKALSCQLAGLDGEPDEQEIWSYARYWHGYVTVLKPLLFFFNLTEIRQLNFFVILAEIMAVAAFACRRKITKYLIPFALALAFINPATVAASLQNSTCFHIMLLALLALLAFWEKPCFQKNLYLYFFCVGMATSYVDLLTYPIVTLGFPLLFYFILCGKQQLLEHLKSLLSYSVLWGIGYGGMWASKWIIGTILTGQDVLSDALHQLSVRAGNDLSNIGKDSASIQETISRQLSYFTGNGLHYVFFAVLAAEAVLLLVLLLKGNRPTKWTTSLMLFTVSFYPFIWYAISQNHSYIHSMFTYRALSVFVMGGVACLLPCIHFSKRKEGPFPEKKEKPLPEKPAEGVS